MDSRERCEHKEDHALDGSQRSAAQNLAQYNGRARNRSDKDRQKESLFAILDHRHHGEDRSEEDDQDQDTGIRVVEIMLLARSSARAERGSEA